MRRRWWRALSRRRETIVKTFFSALAAVAALTGSAQASAPRTADRHIEVGANAPSSSETRGQRHDAAFASGPVLSLSVSAAVEGAVKALAPRVEKTSHPNALNEAFRSYFAYRNEHQSEVKKPYLYFVDYGLPSTAARGYVFDMDALEIVEGPFTVAHGRGSSATREGVPTRFSNASGSATTSLGLFFAAETYGFSGHSGGRAYNSIGVRLDGVSGDLNDQARSRGVVAHGAPYVTATSAGRSEGCPAMEEARAQRLLPKIANGGMVFLFAPDLLD